MILQNTFKHGFLAVLLVVLPVQLICALQPVPFGASADHDEIAHVAQLLAEVVDTALDASDFDEREDDDVVDDEDARALILGVHQRLEMLLQKLTVNPEILEDIKLQDQAIASICFVLPVLIRFDSASTLAASQLLKCSHFAWVSFLAGNVAEESKPCIKAVLTTFKNQDHTIPSPAAFKRNLLTGRQYALMIRRNVSIDGDGSDEEPAE